MSDEILAPQGYETADPLQGTDIQEVYQPASGGVRRNKQENLETLKTYYQQVDGYVSGEILESNAVGKPRTNGITTVELNQSIADTNTNTNNLAANINQGVKTTDTPLFANATIDSKNVGANLDTLNNRVNQGVKSTDTPTFADVNITGLSGTVESRIEGNTADIASNAGDISLNSLNINNNSNGISLNTSRINANSSAIGTNSSNISSNTNSIGANTSSISNNAGNINALENKVGQSLNTNDNVAFNSVTTDNVAIKHKLFTGALDSNGELSITHGLSISKIINVDGLVQHDDGYWVTLSQISPSLNVLGVLQVTTTTLDIDTQYSSSFGSNNYRILVTYTI